MIVVAFQALLFCVEYNIYLQKIELQDSVKIGMEGKILRAKDSQPGCMLESPGKILNYQCHVSPSGF